MRLALLLLAACTGHTTTIVRMARPGEITPMRRWGCEGAGRPAMETYDAVVTFARTHLIQRMDRCARPSDATVHWIAPDLADPPLRDGIQILVEPRATVGSLEISDKSGSWDAGDLYCLHVREEYGMRTVVVQWAGGWIE